MNAQDRPGEPPLVSDVPEDHSASGTLVLVDISRYTTFVAETELAHSQILIGELLAAVVESLGGHLQVSNFEGDAVFLCGDKTGPELTGLFEANHLAFPTRQ